MNLQELTVTHRPVFNVPSTLAFSRFLINQKIPMSIAPTKETTAKSPHLKPNSDTAMSPSSSSQSDDNSKKTSVRPNLRTPPKLTSLSPKSSSFRINTQPTPKSPRQFKEQPPEKNKLDIKTDFLPSSSRQTANSTKEKKNAPLPASVPVLKIVRTQVPTSLLKKLETEHIDHLLMGLLIDDLDAQSILAHQLHTLGRTDSAFYIDHLPEVLKPFAKGTNQASISSSKLMQKVFAEEFRANTGWAEAKIFYANAMFKEKFQGDSPVGENDPSVKEVEREKLKGLAAVIAKSIFGHPATIKNSPLPRRLIEALIYADQRFHEHLLTGKSTKAWTTEQIRDARTSAVKLFLITRLLMPMTTGLAEKKPSQKEIWFLGLAMQTFLKSALDLSKEILIESFATSSSSLQKLAKDKEKYERIQSRTKALKSNAKKSSGHVRSRSADTQLVDIDWLTRRDEVRTKRAQEKANVAIETTRKVLSEVDLDDKVYEQAIEEGGRALREAEDVRKAEADIMDFDLEDIAKIQKMLDDRDGEEMLNLSPEGEITPERAQPLPTSTADFVPYVSSEKAAEDKAAVEKGNT